MKVSRFDWDGEDLRRMAAEIRALQPQLGEVAESVAEILAAVEAEGDAAVLRFEEQFGGVTPKALRVTDDEIQAATEKVPEELLEAIRASIENVRSFGESEVEGEQSVRGAPGAPVVSANSVPMEAAGAYVPGTTFFSYPSTAIMCCVPAATAGVERIVVATPSGADGTVDPTVLTACSLAGATEVYAMGGAQAIAALGLGTATVDPVDIVVGPGSRYVQEAKRQLVGRVGIDGIAGPSELMAIVDGSFRARWIALDLCAQAEHADDGLLIAASADSEPLGAVAAEIDELVRDRDTIQDAALALVKAPSTEAAIELANAVAPEHLELSCENAEALAQDVAYAGCVFIGPGGATAFGDYAAGSNHVLPTGGAGRFQGPLGPRTFMRRITTVRISEQAARELAPTVATLARAEGFPVHAESAEARAKDED